MSTVYTLNGTDGFGCKNTDSVLVKLKEMPSITTGPDKTICYGDSVIVGTSVYDASGNYIDTLALSNGCDSIAELVLTILDMSVFLPNTFTPNEDNLNEEFKAFYSNVQDYEMWIYSRWGELIFYSDKRKGEEKNS